MQCVLRNKANDGWELYEQPEAVLVANSPSEVAMVLASAERAALNKQVVGYVAYEAASAFDPALVTHVGDGPLAVFGIFNEAAPFLPSDFKPTTLLLESSRQYADYQAPRPCAHGRITSRQSSHFGASPASAPGNGTPQPSQMVPPIKEVSRQHGPHRPKSPSTTCPHVKHRVG